MMDNQTMANAKANTNLTKGLSDLSEANRIIELVNDLITTDRGMIDVYQTAVSQLEDEINVALLQEYIEKHKTFVAELSDLIIGYGGTPDTGTNTSSVIKRAWVTLKGVFTEGDGPILTAVVQDAEQVLQAYGEAMGTDLPDDVRDVVRTHLSQARLIHDKLSGLSTAL